MKKRVLSVILALAMLFSCVPAFALQVETGTKLWKQTFEGLLENTAPDDMVLSALPCNYEGAEALGDAERSIAKTEGVLGAFGKTASDTAFMAQTQYEGSSLPVISPDTSAYLGPTLKNNTGSDDKTAIFSGVTSLAADDILHISFEYAINNYAHQRKVTMRTRPSTKNVADTHNTFLVFKTDATVKLFDGLVENFTMPLNKWVKFDFVIKEPQASEGGSLIDMYADGVKVVSDRRFDAKSGKTSGVNGYMDAFKGLGTIMFYFQMGANDGAYPLTQTYLDNYLVEVVKEDIAVGTFNLEHSDPEINGGIDNALRSVLLPDSLTVEQLISGLTDKNATVVNADGEELSGTDRLENGYIRATDTAGTNIYYNLETFAKSYFINEDFTGKTITNASELEENTVFSLRGGIDGSINTVLGLRGRESDDISLSIEADDFSFEDGKINYTSLDYTGDVGAGFVFEGSVLTSGDANAHIIFKTAEEEIEAVRFDRDFNIYVEDTAVSEYEKDGFYKVAVASDAEGASSVYINGVKIYDMENALADITGVSVKMSMPEEDGTYSGKILADDIKMYSGEYVSGADETFITSLDDSVIVYGKNIYIAQDETKEGLMSKCVFENSQFKGFFTSMALEEESMLSDGCVLLTENLAGGVFERYNIIFVTEPLGIVNAKYEYDNSEKYIYVPVKTKASDLLSALELHRGHTAKVTDGENDIAADSLFEADSKLYLRIEYAGFYTDYEIRNTYFNEDFSELYGSKVATSGGMINDLKFSTTSLAASEASVYAEGVEIDGEKAGKIYTNVSSAASDAKITLRASDFPERRSKEAFVITWDFKTDNTAGLNSIIFKYTRKTGEENSYYNLMDLQGGNVKIGGSIVSTFEANQWVKIVVAMSPSGYIRAFVNGKQVKSGTINFYQKLADHIDEIIFAYGAVKGERTTYTDNLAFYPITDINAFDASPMDSTLTSEYDIIGKDNTITNYGYGSIEDVLGLVSAQEGADICVRDENSNVVNDYTIDAKKGITITVTSPDGMYNTVYTLGDEIYVKAELLINERPLSYLVEGTAKAACEIKSVLPYEVVLTAGYKNINNPELDNEIVIEKTISGEEAFETDALAEILNVDGEELYLSLKEKGTGKDILPPVKIEYTGQLDLSSEITDVKYGRKSIVTLTMDDGVAGGVTKYNNWFKQYGLKGTAMIWATRLQENAAFYKGIFDQGYIDLGSHSKTHIDLTGGSVTDEIRYAEVVESQSIMKNLFPGQQVITYAPAENRLDSASDILARQTYWAMRQGKRGYNSLNPAEDGNGGWYDLKIQGIHNPVDESGNACAINDMLDIAASKPMWLVEMFHGVDSGYGAVSTSDGQSHFSYMAKLQEEGKIWCASFAEATKYIRERQNTTIEDVATESSRTIKLTMTGLDGDIFNYPLTVKSEIPAEWTYAKVTQGTNVQAPEIKIEDGRCYIYYDAIPNGGDITVENVSQLPQITIKELRISSSGNLVQNAGSVSDISVNANITPAENVDTSGLLWYVNDSVIQEGGSTYEFDFQAAGEYEIVLKDSVTGLVSNSIIVTVKLPGILFEESFEGYEGQTTVPTSSIYSNATVNLFSENENSMAEFYYDSAALYPAFHKTVDYTLSKPVVYNAKVKLVNDGNKKQSFYLEMRNSADGSSGNRKTVLQLSGGNITDINGDIIAKLADGNTLNFSLAILASEEGSEATFKYTLSSSELYDANGENKGKTVTHQASAVIDNIAVFTNNKANMLFNNNFSKANENAKTYIDDIMIYNTDKVLFDVVSAEGKVIKIKTTADVYNVDKTKITITSGEDSIAVSEAYMNPDNPYELIIETAALPENGKEYRISVNDAVSNAWHEPVSGECSFTFEGKEEKLYTLDVSAIDASVLCLTTNENWGDSKVGEYESGKALKLKAVADDGATFMYWKDKISGKILSKNEEYEFVVGTGKTLIAVCTKENSVYVSFVNMNSKVITEGYLTSQIVVPSDPYIAGYSFAGWYLNGKKQSFKAGDVVENLSQNAKFSAGYTKDETLYEITVTGALQQGGSYTYNTKITVDADIDKFSHWTKNGIVVSYNESYTFFVSENADVKAVAGEEAKKDAVIVMSQPVVVMENKLSFYAERSLAEEYTIVESGILLHKASGVSLENYTHKAVAANNKNTGQFTVRKANVKENEAWYAVGYMLYKDKEDNLYIVYSNEVNKKL